MDQAWDVTKNGYKVASAHEVSEFGILQLGDVLWGYGGTEATFFSQRGTPLELEPAA